MFFLRETMKHLIYFLFILLVAMAPSASASPTFGDLAVFFAKGYFKEYVSSDASMQECVQFLNGKGICFSLFDLLDPDARVLPEDFSRVMGQSTLLFLGEASLKGGCIERPKGIKSWVDYCLLNDVDSAVLWRSFVRRAEGDSGNGAQ